MNTFGNYIKELRLNRDLTLREFCKRAAIDSSNWSKIERGIKTPPKTKKELLHLTKILDISEGDEEFQSLLDLAITASIPKELIGDEKILEKLPLFFRTTRGENPKEEDLKELFNLIKTSHEPEE